MDSAATVNTRPKRAISLRTLLAFGVALVGFNVPLIGHVAALIFARQAARRRTTAIERAILVATDCLSFIGLFFFLKSMYVLVTEIRDPLPDPPKPRMRDH